MQIKPINKIKRPDYPNEYLFINNPELFNNFVPQRWFKNKVVASALLAFLAACSQNKDKQHAPAIVMMKDFGFGNRKDIKINNPKELIAKTPVAPIFVHGDGNGTIGCIVMSPPVFISEHDAKVLIMEEFSKANIKFDTAISENFKIKIRYDIDGRRTQSNSLPALELKPDGMIGVDSFMVKYISAAYFEYLQPYLGGLGCSIENIETKLAANILRDGFINDHAKNAVFFYDPLYYPSNDNFLEKNNFTHAESKRPNIFDSRTEDIISAKELLTAQVRDFINWLKKEGYLEQNKN